MKINKILSGFMAILMTFGVFGVFGGIYTIEANAAPATTEDKMVDYTTTVYNTPEEKLATMVKKVEQNGFELWVQEETGEVATVNQKTGQIMFTNPYDVASASNKASVATKEQLLSQIIVKYTDNDTEKYFYSYTEAALREQIKVKNIKNGIRIEYTLGREETRYLVPRMIRKERFEELIVNNITTEFDRKQLTSFYTLMDPNEETLSERALKEMQLNFPITKKMAVYVIANNTKPREFRLVEGYIKKHCPLYSYEELEKDHMETEYTGSDVAPPLFKLSLEYTLDDLGVTVRLPANGIRFDETTYKLNEVRILPYMGANSTDFKGYTFIPDGSGTLLRTEDLIGKNATITGQIYGQDFAYHTITGAHVETMRLPVYGVVENRAGKKTVETTKDVVVTDPETGEQTTKTETVKESVDYKEDKGFLAIIEEGDALASITASHGGALHKYNSVYTSFFPRPKDSYNLADAISVGANATWTVESTRKYVGNYKIRFIMLTDKDIAKEKGITDYYEASWVGMAKAYRSYLEKKGVLTKLTNEQVKEDIPLYIETFGAIDSVERILSIPVTVSSPLTSFDNVKQMYDELKQAGITNLNFKLTGYANGGMSSTVPYNLKWEKSVGGKSGFKDLLSYAKQNDFGIYPDFDFVYINNVEKFDGVSLKKHAVKTIDNRYSSKRVYDAALQSFVSYFNLCISPSMFDRFYTKLTDTYIDYDPIGISVSTLGSDLNSDFDKKDPYNREDAKGYTVDTFKSLSKDYASVMSDGGNSYILQYVDHLLNVSLDSSRYLYSSEAVPFLGMVLHGYKNFAGSPINMAADIDYDMLKAIENGASMYLTLSYQNISKLKESGLFSKYYSVRYDIWFDELVEKYNKLNDVMSPLQTYLITDHEFLIGERIPDADEIEADRIEAEKKAEAKKKADEEKAAKDALQKQREDYEAGKVDAGKEITVQPAEPKPDETNPAETDNSKYVYTKYTSDDGRIVKVTYENGTSFILNYNGFSVTVVDKGVTHEIGSYGFVMIK